MNSSILGQKASSIIDEYLHFKVGQASCSVPYFNNRSKQRRAALRVAIGKGSPHEIFDEVSSISLHDRIPKNTFRDDSLKKFLVDNNIGIDCSGFAYYILNAEVQEKLGISLKNKIIFTYCKGLAGKIRSYLRPIENCDVRTLAHDENSRMINLSDIRAGDMITMLRSDTVMTANDTADRTNSSTMNDSDHILIIHKVDYLDSIPDQIYYSHAVAYPKDGLYGTGIRQGKIMIINPQESITEQLWQEDGKEGEENSIFLRARNSLTEIRRLKSL